MKTERELLAERGELLTGMESLIAAGDAESRDLNDAEQSQYDTGKARIAQIDADLARRAEITALRNAAHAQQRTVPAHPTRMTAETPEAIWLRHLRTGDPAAMAELRAYNNTDMNVTTAADGEVIVPVGMVRDIMARRDEMALFPKLGVTNVPGKGTTVNYPIDNEADVEFLAEAESATIDQDAPALSEKAFTLVKYAKFLTLTWELLRDEDANLLSFINNWVARGLAATENKALITEVLANGTAGLTLDGAAAITGAEIPELVGKLLPEYQDGAAWIMHPTTFAYLSGIASSSVFTFAPQPGGNLAGGGQTLWGYPVYQSSYATALAASAKSLAFGNFQFLGRRQGTGLTALRDPYSVATSGQIRLHYWFDLVYGVLQAEAIQYASHPSA